MIHLDTNFLIRALVPGSDQDRRLREWLRGGELVGMSTVGWAEFLCGPLDSGESELASLVVMERVPFLEEDAVIASRFFNESGRRRGSLPDCMIAATALRVGAGLATANPKHFRRFEPFGLTVLSSAG
jgi:predicted nucleic acid-binding protein